MTARLRSSTPEVVGLLNNFTLDQLSTSARGNAGKPFAVCGAGVASAGTVRALLEFGGFERYELFALPHRVRDVSASLASVRRAARSKSIRVNECRQLLTGGTRGFGIWYDAHASYFPTAAYVRDRFSRQPYPITGTIHTISYQSQLHETILPILLANAYPFDSIVCTSRAARAAFAALLDHVADHATRTQGLRLHWPGRLEVIPFGVDTEVFRPRDKAAIRRKLKLPVGPCIVLCVGRLSAVDKMDLLPLLTVMKRLVGKVRNTSLLLLITGSDYRGEATLLTRAIRSLGLAAHARVIPSPESISDLYSAADVFVSPADSVQESFGLTILEAMASGLPQVVSDWDGYRDTVRHGETGFLVPTYWSHCDGDLSALGPLAERTLEFDHASLAQSVAVDLGQLQTYLELLLTNAPLRRDMGRKAREVAAAEYSWRAMTGRYEALWRELMRTASRTAPLRRPPAQIAPRHIGVFGHYATTLLSDASRLQLTPAGLEMRRRKVGLPDYSCAAQLNLLREPILQNLLRRLLNTRRHPRGAAPGGVTFGEVRRSLAAEYAEHPDFIGRHVMWLVKYGLVESDATIEPPMATSARVHLQSAESSQLRRRTSAS